MQLEVVELLVILLNQVWAQAGRQSTRRMASLDMDRDTDYSKGKIRLGRLQATENTNGSNRLDHPTTLNRVISEPFLLGKIGRAGLALLAIFRNVV